MEIENKNICLAFITYIQSHFVPLVDATSPKSFYAIESLKRIKNSISNKDFNVQQLNQALLSHSYKQDDFGRIMEKESNYLKLVKNSNGKEGMGRSQIKYPYDFLLKPPGISYQRHEYQTQYQSKAQIINKQNDECFNSLINIFQKINKNFQQSHFHSICNRSNCFKIDQVI